MPSPPLRACRGPARRLLLTPALLVGLAACAAPASRSGGPPPTPTEAEGAPSEMGSTDIRVTLVQLNDVYEITPVGGGRWGGMARVATLVKRLEAWNPNTRVVIAGDFFSPSALGTARVDGERLAGRQMVSVMNRVGLDYATFGNHEFDLDEEAFRARLAESDFEYFSANVRTAGGEPIPGVDDVEVLRFFGAAGDTLRLGLIGVTWPEMGAPYVAMSDPVEAVRRTVDRLRDSVQALVAVTHLPLADDAAMTEAVPELDLVIGGHEHENWMARRGPNLTPIAKADANARTVYVHELRWDPRVQRLDVDSRLVPVTDDIPGDAAVEDEVREWLDLAWAGYRAAGLDPEAEVAVVTEPLDGREAIVRNRETTLTRLITAGMRAEVEGSQVAIVNSGSIRIDDELPPGPVTQYDVIRVLPFGGPVMEVEMRGDLLGRVLDQGLANAGAGGFLHADGVRREANGWRVGDAPLDPDATYRVAISDFLITGREMGLEFLSRDAPGLTVVAEHRDIRQVLIRALAERYGG